MEWSSYFLGLLSGLSVAVLLWIVESLVSRRAAGRVDAAIARDGTLNALREAVADLDEALHPIPIPASEAGDDKADKAIIAWKNSLITAMNHLQFTIPNAPHRPIPDPSLVDRIDKMEQMADEAIAALAQQTGVQGDRGYQTTSVGMQWGYELLSEARFVQECYEAALREHLRRKRQRS